MSGGKLLQLSEYMKSFPICINTIIICDQCPRSRIAILPQAPRGASLPVFARGYSNTLCIAGNSSYCHLKVLLGSRVNSLCPSSCFRHPMASAKQLYVDLNHTNVFKSLNYKTGNFLFRVTEKRFWWRGGEIFICFSSCPE